MRTPVAETATNAGPDQAHATDDGGRKGLQSRRDTQRVMYICWADDTWIFAKSAKGVRYLVHTAEEAVARMARMEIRQSKCPRMRIQRQGTYCEELRSAAQSANLLKMKESPARSCINEVGSDVQPDGFQHLEFRCVGRVAWAACHAQKALWNAPGQLRSNLRVLHITVFASLAWTAGTRQWTASEVQGFDPSTSA